jgi:N-methylhydantoinase B
LKVASPDSITLAVVRAGLINAVAEMKAVVLRTAYSNLWKEAGDLSCGLLTVGAEVVVQGIGDIPVHLASMPMSLRGCTDHISPESLRPGDVLYQNDPYRGNTHLPDFMMAKPVFFGGHIVAYTAVRGHYVDIGGSGPGSYSTVVSDLYGEGLRIPPVRIYEQGALNQDIVDVLCANTRNSRERLGDLRSQYAGCVAAERRVISFCEKYGADVFCAAMEEVLNASERLTRAAIAEIPNGQYYYEDWCDGDGVDDGPIKIAATVTVEGDEITVDFSDSAKQTRGGMNAPLAVTVSATVYALKCLTDQENPANSGSYRPVTIHAPIGSVVNPRPPAPVVAGNHETGSRIADVIIGALSEALPHRVAAADSGSSGLLLLGAQMERDDGTVDELVLVEVHGAGHGANAERDGINARRTNIGNTANTPNEILETTFPITVLSYGISVDGGGAGRQRGGTGITRVIRLDHDATLTIAAERAVVPPHGLFGGLAAPAAEFRLELPDGTSRSLASKTPPVYLPRGTILHFRCAGGGGYGPTVDRPLELIQDDLDDGYVTPECARSIYGMEVVFDNERVEGPWVAQRPAPALA